MAKKQAVKPLYVWLTRYALKDTGMYIAHIERPQPTRDGSWYTPGDIGNRLALCSDALPDKLKAAGIKVKPGGDKVRCRLVLDEPKAKPKRKPKPKGKK